MLPFLSSFTLENAPLAVRRETARAGSPPALSAVRLPSGDAGTRQQEARRALRLTTTGAFVALIEAGQGELGGTQPRRLAAAGHGAERGLIGWVGSCGVEADGGGGRHINMEAIFHERVSEPLAFPYGRWAVRLKRGRSERKEKRFAGSLPGKRNFAVSDPWVVQRLRKSLFSLLCFYIQAAEGKNKNKAQFLVIRGYLERQGG